MLSPELKLIVESKDDHHHDGFYESIYILVLCKLYMDVHVKWFISSDHSRKKDTVWGFQLMRRQPQLKSCRHVCTTVRRMPSTSTDSVPHFELEDSPLEPLHLGQAGFIQ